MLPKYKQQHYIGYEDGSKSIKYYNADTKIVLTSRNFHFMNNIDQQTPSKYIIPDPSPALQHEGELGDDMPQADTSGKNITCFDCLWCLWLSLAVFGSIWLDLKIWKNAEKS